MQSGLLEWLFAPHTKNCFLTEILGRRCLHIAGQEGRFRDLVTWEDINRLLTFGGMAPPRLRLLKGQDEAPAELYAHRNPEGLARLRAAGLTALLREGATLAINSIHEMHEPVARFCESVEQELETCVSADLYATWRQTDERVSGWNDHETIVLQIAGRKAWALYEPTEMFPTAASNCPKPAASPAWEGMIVPGDLVYVPRGWWFGEVAFDEPSLYLALRFRNPTGWDLVVRRMGQLQSVDAIRMDVPRFGQPEMHGPFLTAVQSEITRLGTAPGLLLGICKDMLAASEPRVTFGLPWSAEAAALPPSEDYEIVSLMRFPRREAVFCLEREAGVELLASNGRPIRFPLEAAGLLECVCEDRRLALGALLERFVNEIPKDRALGYVAELVKQGFISMRAPQPAALPPRSGRRGPSADQVKSGA